MNTRLRRIADTVRADLARKGIGYAKVVSDLAGDQGGAPVPSGLVSMPTKTGEPAIAAAMLPCVHRGPATAEVVPCGGCLPRAVWLRVFPCKVHGSCVPTVQIEGRGFCGRCPDRVEQLPHAPTSAADATGQARTAEQLGDDQGDDNQGGVPPSIG